MENDANNATAYHLKNSLNGAERSFGARCFSLMRRLDKTSSRLQIESSLSVYLLGLAFHTQPALQDLPDLNTDLPLR